jgi:hypothetical protein
MPETMVAGWGDGSVNAEAASYPILKEPSIWATLRA